MLSRWRARYIHTNVRKKQYVGVDDNNDVPFNLYLTTSPPSSGREPPSAEAQEQYMIARCGKSAGGVRFPASSALRRGCDLR